MDTGQGFKYVSNMHIRNTKPLHVLLHLSSTKPLLVESVYKLQGLGIGC